MSLNFQAKARVLTIYSVFADSPLRNGVWSGLSREDMGIGLSCGDMQGPASAVRTGSCSQTQFHTLTGPVKWPSYLLPVPRFLHWERSWHSSPGISWNISWDVCLHGACFAHECPEALPSWHPGCCVRDGEALPHSLSSQQQEEGYSSCFLAGGRQCP